MNYSNMIPDKHAKLKQAFVVSVLVSTIAGTFTTAINLFDRIGETRKQHRKDKGQDTKIKELEKQVEEMEKKKKNEPRQRDDDIHDSLQQGGPVVRRQYDQNFQRLGPQFAQGDAIGQNQLQSQLIMLQSEVIMMLQEGIMSGRIRDVNRLYNASELAREGSINALRDQYQRMMQAAPPRRPPGSVRRISSTPTLASHGGRQQREPPPPGTRPPRRGTERMEAYPRDEGEGVAEPPPPGTRPARSRTERVTAYPSEDGEGVDEAGPGTIGGVDETSGTKVMLMDDSGPLFCRYALDLQHSSEPLEARFRRGGPLACPECGTRVGVQFGRAWRITREMLRERRVGERFEDEVAEERTYLLSNRFVVKCHREQAGFACVLCSRYRYRDTVCPTAEGLVKHVWQQHEAAEYEDEVDIRDVGLTKERTSKRFQY